MIYVKITVSPLEKDFLVNVNTFIDWLENLKHVPVYLQKWLIKLVLKNEDELKEVQDKVSELFKDIRFNYINEEDKTETLTRIKDSVVYESYLLPLFPEDYKF